MWASSFTLYSFPSFIPFLWERISAEWWCKDVWALTWLVKLHWVSFYSVSFPQLLRAGLQPPPTSKPKPSAALRPESITGSEALKGSSASLQHHHDSLDVKAERMKTGFHVATDTPGPLHGHTGSVWMESPRSGPGIVASMELRAECSVGFCASLFKQSS